MIISIENTGLHLSQNCPDQPRMRISGSGSKQATAYTCRNWGVPQEISVKMLGESQQNFDLKTSWKQIRITTLCNLHNNTISVLLLPLSNLYDKMHSAKSHITDRQFTYEGWNFNSGNYLFTTDTK